VKIAIHHACTDPDLMPFDTAERKGVGHPDSLADLVADTFSLRYASWSQGEFGAVPNHWVDKVNLVGCVADVDFGRFTIRKPIDCYLFGKITDHVGPTTVPIEDMFRDTVSQVLATALGDTRALDHVKLHINNTRGVAVDHDPQFYLPKTPGRIAEVLATETVANDTVICVGTSRRGLAADLAVRLERHITGDTFRRGLPAIGTDVKVVVVRIGTSLDITAAVPFHPEAVGSWDTYRSYLAEVQIAISTELKAMLDRDPRARGLTETSLHLNTKDVPGRGYLTPFGTSLGKGDCGAVGRGNRFAGAIEPLRPASGEAPAGKNPVHHAGKIYTSVAAETARQIYAETSLYAEVTIAARNGAPLDDPAHVLVAVDRRVDARTASAVQDVVRRCIAGAARFKDHFLSSDPMAEFRGRGAK
jgi:S-adenosylmethionine synthetase